MTRQYPLEQALVVLDNAGQQAAGEPHGAFEVTVEEGHVQEGVVLVDQTGQLVSGPLAAFLRRG